MEKLGGHRPSAPLRGGKYSAFDGGTRVPMIVRWPGRVKPGVSDALVGQVDLLASFAALTGHSLAPGDGPDSLDLLDFHVVCFFNCGIVHQSKGLRYRRTDTLAATECIRRQRKPCIGYKIMAPVAWTSWLVPVLVGLLLTQGNIWGQDSTPKDEPAAKKEVKEGMGVF